MSFFSARRSFAALAVLVLSSGVFAAPANPAAGVLDGVLPRWSANQDYGNSDGAVEARGYKSDGGKWPETVYDCSFDGRREERGDWYEHDGGKFESDCLLKLSLSIDSEKRECCKSKHAKHGFEDECLLELVFKLDIDVEIKEEEEKHVEEWDWKHHHPTRKSDCLLEKWGKFGSRGEDAREEEWCSWSSGGKEKYDDVCLLKLSLSLDIDIKKSCKKERRGGNCQGYDNQCMLDLAISLDLELDLDIVDNILGGGDGGSKGNGGGKKALGGIDNVLGSLL